MLSPNRTPSSSFRRPERRRDDCCFRQRAAGPAVVAGVPRLWSIGGCVNTMRWFEVLSAALFTLDVTGSGFAVALVSAARTMPMFLLGAFSGVVTEAVNRKQVLLFGQILTCLASASVALLAWAGVARPWHVAVAALVAGIVWSTEMATRRRMVGECVESRLVSRALALDTMSNSFTRLLGPVFAGDRFIKGWGWGVRLHFPRVFMRWRPCSLRVWLIVRLHAAWCWETCRGNWLKVCGSSAVILSSAACWPSRLP